jgi:hypothetical protein
MGQPAQPKVMKTPAWRGLSVCRADTLVGALRPEEVRVEKSLDPAGKSACTTSNPHGVDSVGRTSTERHHDCR